MARSALILAVALMAVCGPGACRPAPERGLALVGVTVLDGSEGPPLEGALIVIEGAHITSVGPQTHVSLPKGVRLVDVQGAFALPALDAAALETIEARRQGEAPAAALARALRVAYATGRRIAPGAPADLIVLRGDPRRDPGRLRVPHVVVASGRLVEVAQAADHHP